MTKNADICQCGWVSCIQMCGGFPPPFRPLYISRKVGFHLFLLHDELYVLVPLVEGNQEFIQFVIPMVPDDKGIIHVSHPYFWFEYSGVSFSKPASKSSIKIYATTGERGEHMVAPSFC